MADLYSSGGGSNVESCRGDQGNTKGGPTVNLGQTTRPSLLLPWNADARVGMGRLWGHSRKTINKWPKALYSAVSWKKNEAEGERRSVKRTREGGDIETTRERDVKNDVAERGELQEDGGEKGGKGENTVGKRARKTKKAIPLLLS